MRSGGIYTVDRIFISRIVNSWCWRNGWICEGLESFRGCFFWRVFSDVFFFNAFDYLGVIFIVFLMVLSVIIGF